MGITRVSSDSLKANVVAEIHDKRRHQICGSRLAIPGANHCGTENVFADNGDTVRRKAHFTNFLFRQLKCEIRVNGANREKNETEAPCVDALEEHERFKPLPVQEDKSVLIFKAR